LWYNADFLSCRLAWGDRLDSKYILVDNLVFTRWDWLVCSVVVIDFAFVDFVWFCWLARIGCQVATELSMIGLCSRIVILSFELIGLIAGRNFADYCYYIRAFKWKDVRWSIPLILSSALRAWAIAACITIFKTAILSETRFFVFSLEPGITT
jgi:hypothetical protein